MKAGIKQILETHMNIKNNHTNLDCLSHNVMLNRNLQRSIDIINHLDSHNKIQ